MDVSGVQAAVSSTGYQTAQNSQTSSTNTSSLFTLPIMRSTKAADTSGATVQSQSLDFISAVASTPQPIDSKKIQAIRDLIASGAYPINARAVANKMVDLDLRQ